MRALLPKKARLDQLCGELVRARGKCQRCGTNKNLTWAHIIGRSCYRTRWRTDNALCLCLDCHYYFDQTEEGKQEFESFVISVIGERKYQELVRASSYNWNTFQKVDYGKVMYDLNKEKKRLFS